MSRAECVFVGFTVGLFYATSPDWFPPVAVTVWRWFQ